MSDLFDLQKALDGIQSNADWVGLREVREEIQEYKTRDSKPQENSTRIDHGVFVEACVGGHFGYSSTNFLSQAAIQKAIEEAERLATKSAEFAIFHFDPDSARPKASGSYQSLCEQPLDAWSRKELNDFLRKACETLKVCDTVISTEANFQTLEHGMRFVSTNGSDIRQNIAFVSSDFNATARKDNIIQHRTDNGFRAHCYQKGLEYLNEDEILTRARLIGEQAVELLDAEDCPSEKLDLVLAPDQMMLQIHESIGHPLELDRILGDEKNFAGYSFVRLDDFGTYQYGSPHLNVTFDPGVQSQFASYGFDDAGYEAKKEYLIKDGRLIRPLGGRESQLRAGIQGTANFRASTWCRAPIDRMANINLEPGNSSFDDIISSVERGVYMQANKSWSIDDYRNKFQFGCEYAQLIENGKLTKTLKNPNYRGVTKSFWKNLHKVGNQDTWRFYGTPYCGKGEPSQVIRVGHASPVCLFKNIDVFGGAA